MWSLRRFAEQYGIEISDTATQSEVADLVKMYLWNCLSSLGVFIQFPLMRKVFEIGFSQSYRMYVFFVQISDQVKTTTVIKSDAHSLSEPRKIKRPKKVGRLACFVIFVVCRRLSCSNKDEGR